MPQYQYAIYNNQFPDVVQGNLNAMSDQGWHVHTCLPNYTEFAVLWERDTPVQTMSVPLGTAEVKVAAQPVTPVIDPDTVTKADLQDMAREQGLPVSGTKADLAAVLSSPPVPPG